MQTKKVGLKAENQAKKFLLNKGYRFITQNFHTRFGEIDLIFVDHGTTVFVEVKARHKVDQGLPEEAVNLRKLKKIAKVAEYFLQKHAEFPQRARIDVIALELDLTPPLIRHLKNVTS